MGSLQDLTLSTKLLQALGPADSEIIQAKYASKPICKMDPSELLTNSIISLKRIHVITGWVIPNDPDYVRILGEEFSLKLKEDFYMLNFDEIRLAYRKLIGRQDWGKNMNLELLSDVLGAFCAERSRVSDEERKLRQVEPPQKIYTDEEINNQRRGEFEKAYQAMRQGHLPIIYDYYEELLVLDGILPLGENLHEWISNQLNKGVECIFKFCQVQNA